MFAGSDAEPLPMGPTLFGWAAAHTGVWPNAYWISAIPAAWALATAASSGSQLIVSGVGWRAAQATPLSQRRTAPTRKPGTELLTL